MFLFFFILGTLREAFGRKEIYSGRVYFFKKCEELTEKFRSCDNYVCFIAKTSLPYVMYVQYNVIHVT